jgi:DNA mismatch repair protein MutS
VARDSGYTRPVVDDSTVLEIIGGRHPVVERLLAHQFIANDARLSANVEGRMSHCLTGAIEANAECPTSESGLRHSDFPQIVILTGPNMAGKSTYLRQVALIAIMAQVGSFVPASRARVGVIDKVFTRIGASDDLSRGVSTFLAEMTETANILNNATTRSLVILDEIGRGTSTSDGVAIAWATVEYLHGKVESEEGEISKSGHSPQWPLSDSASFPLPTSGSPSPCPKTLFATHYHELTDITQLLPRCQNFSFTVKEQRGQVLFMRKLKPGPADKSYGIAVARLAGLPPSVIERAKQVQADFEKGEALSIGQLAPGGDMPGKPGLHSAPSAPRDCPEFSGGVAMAADKPASESDVHSPESIVLGELRDAEVEKLSPLQAFDLLLRLKQRLEQPKSD